LTVLPFAFLCLLLLLLLLLPPLFLLFIVNPRDGQRKSVWWT